MKFNSKKNNLWFYGGCYEKTQCLPAEKHLFEPEHFALILVLTMKHCIIGKAAYINTSIYRQEILHNLHMEEFSNNQWIIYTQNWIF